MNTRVYSILLLTLFCFASGVYGIQITALRVPTEIRNGSGKDTVLDCEYTLRSDELAADSGLVIKWFFNNSPAPVYQWIPGQRPQDLGILRGRLNLNYRASNHDATMHRALCIVNPTTELSGEYKCAVSTFTDEDFMIKRMIVFATAKRVDFIQRKQDLENVNISCRGFGLYPEPKVTLYKGADRNKEQLQGVIVETSSKRGHYDISATILLADQDLNTSTDFHCELRIPGTTYVTSKSLQYYPGRLENIPGGTDGAAATKGSIVPLLLMVVFNVTGVWSSRR